MSEDLPMNTGVAAANGVQLHYEEVGEGRPVLFLHGLWASSRFFRGQLQAVGRRHRAISVDLRGHGRSSMSAGGHTVPTFAADVKAFIEVMGLDQPVLVGWSMGAFIAWEMYKQFGALDVRGLVVVDQAPTDFRFPGFPDALLGLEELRDWHAQTLTDRNVLMKAVLPMMFHTPPVGDDEDWMLGEMCRAPEAIAAAVFVDQSLRDYRETIVGYPLPTLVCSGAHSAQPLSGARLICDSAAQARLEVFEHSGHCLFLEEADRFNALLLEFLESLP